LNIKLEGQYLNFANVGGREEKEDLHVSIGKKGHGHSGVFIAVIFGRKKKKFIPRKKISNLTISLDCARKKIK
jgi:hypothetical protein